MCEHYDKKCVLYCEECKSYFGCHKCHQSEVKDHTFDRNNLKLIKCNLCNTTQKPSIKCVFCDIAFSEYFCELCSYFGNKQNYHCKECNICYLSPVHTVCIKDFCKQTCSICLDEYGSLPTFTTQCKHTFHTDCLLTYTKNNGSKCPLCRYPYGNKDIKCNFCGESFYGKPRGTKLGCGHYYHLEPLCIVNLSTERDANSNLITAKCLCGYIHKTEEAYNPVKI